MDRKELITSYLEFFRLKKHKIVKPGSLIPENDPTVLFTTAGMHPLVPYILGQKHPEGKRLVNFQPCIRTGDIDSVGDDMHLTFFEMLGNWSLGDYWKKEAIEWSFKFLTENLKFRPEQLHVTVFSGENDIPRDEESAQVWQSMGIPKSRIYYLGKEHNFWGPAGLTGPCGPCTEMFIDTGRQRCKKGRECKPGCDCGKYFEIWNDVFMEYSKDSAGKYEQLKQRNVDTGMGVERTIAMMEGKKSVYDIEIFLPIIKKIKSLSSLKDFSKSDASIRIIADHLKAAAFILSESVQPSNVERGYVLRRLIRKSVRHGKLLGIEKNFCSEIAKEVISVYSQDYNRLKDNEKFILEEMQKEETRFMETLENGLKRFDALAGSRKEISGAEAFLLFQSFGFPLEMTAELAKEKGIKVDVKGFEEELRKHQELSRTASSGMFKGGLADKSEITTKYHTATHMLHQALRNILGNHVQQKGSNITSERLRFDFSHHGKMTSEEIKKVEDLINGKIKEGLEVSREEMSMQEAHQQGALAFFGERYSEKVSVYSVGEKGKEFSKEVCGGPHVNNTKELGEGGKKFRIIKEESVSAGVRRIKAVLE